MALHGQSSQAVAMSVYIAIELERLSMDSLLGIGLVGMWIALAIVALNRAYSARRRAR